MSELELKSDTLRRSKEALLNIENVCWHFTEQYMPPQMPIVRELVQAVQMEIYYTRKWILELNEECAEQFWTMNQYINYESYLVILETLFRLTKKIYANFNNDDGILVLLNIIGEDAIDIECEVPYGCIPENEAVKIGDLENYSFLIDSIKLKLKDINYMREEFALEVHRNDT